jgi:hypothetical protein
LAAKGIGYMEPQQPHTGAERNSAVLMREQNSGGISMTEQQEVMGNDGVSRRSFLGRTSAALVAAASLPILAAAQQTRDMSQDTHTEEPWS